MSETIRLENIVKIAPDGRRAVNGVSFVVHEREHICVCGAPGSGKSALMRLIAGMDAPEAGQVFVMGQPVHEMDKDAAAIFRNWSFGICLRNPSLMQDLSVWENVALSLAIRGMPTAQRKKTAFEQLKVLGISYCANARPARLLPYEAQLASIARAVIAHPPILLMDGVAADLPERQAMRINEILNALSQFSEASVIIFTVMECGLPTDKRLILEHGKIKEGTL